MINKSLEKSKTPSGFEFWMIINKDNMQVIGDIGFHGLPNELGEVEIGFGLVEKVRGQGFGFESLKAIIKWLGTIESVKAIKANCLISNKASAKILAKVGMKEITQDNDLIYWELII